MSDVEPGVQYRGHLAGAVDPAVEQRRGLVFVHAGLAEPDPDVSLVSSAPMTAGNPEDVVALRPARPVRLSTSSGDIRNTTRPNRESVAASLRHAAPVPVNSAATALGVGVRGTAATER